MSNTRAVTSLSSLAMLAKCLIQCASNELEMKTTAKAALDAFDFYAFLPSTRCGYVFGERQKRKGEKGLIDLFFPSLLLQLFLCFSIQLFASRFSLLTSLCSLLSLSATLKPASCSPLTQHIEWMCVCVRVSVQSSSLFRWTISLSIYLISSLVL